MLAFQIAARVREFAKSDDKELVFPSGLSAGERNAAHSLAAAEGLGHESRGDEGKRTLHLWKVRTRHLTFWSHFGRVNRLSGAARWLGGVTRGTWRDEGR